MEAIKKRSNIQKKTTISDVYSIISFLRFFPLDIFPRLYFDKMRVSKQ